MQDNIKDLYNALTEDGYDFGSEDDFRKNISNVNNTKELYAALTEDGYDFGSEDDFLHNVMPKPQSSWTVGAKSTPSKKPKSNGMITQSIYGDQYTAKKNYQQGYEPQPQAVPASLYRPDEQQSKLVQGLQAQQNAFNYQQQNTPLQHAKEAAQRQKEAMQAPAFPDMEAPQLSRSIADDRQKYKGMMTQNIQKAVNAGSKTAVSDAVQQTYKELARQGYDVEALGKSGFMAEGIENVLAPTAETAVTKGNKLIDQVFDDAKIRAAKARSEQTRYTGMGGAGSAAASRLIGEIAYNKEIDPDKLQAQLTESLDKNALRETFAEVQAQAEKYGIDPTEYFNSYVAPRLREKASKALDKFMVDQYMPKDDMEYVLSGFSDSITGMLTDWLTKTAKQNAYKQQALSEYGKNAGTGTKIAREAVGLVASTPEFMVSGGVASAATKKIFGRAITDMVARGFTEAQARNILAAELSHRFGQRVASNILQHAVSGAANFATLDAMSEAARGVRDDDFDIGNVLGKAASGAGKGMVFGTVGGAYAGATAELTGAKKVISNLLGVPVNGAALTASSNAMNYLNMALGGEDELATELGKDGEMHHKPLLEQWAENSLTDLMMRATNHRNFNLITSDGRREIAARIRDTFSGRSESQKLMGKAWQAGGLDERAQARLKAITKCDNLRDALSYGAPGAADKAPLPYSADMVKSKSQSLDEILNAERQRVMEQNWDNIINDRELTAKDKMALAAMMGARYQPNPTVTMTTVKDANGNQYVEYRDAAGCLNERVSLADADLSLEAQNKIRLTNIMSKVYALGDTGKGVIIANAMRYAMKPDAQGKEPSEEQKQQRMKEYVDRYLKQELSDMEITELSADLDKATTLYGGADKIKVIKDSDGTASVQYSKNGTPIRTDHYATEEEANQKAAADMFAQELDITNMVERPKDLQAYYEGMNGLQEGAIEEAIKGYSPDEMEEVRDRMLSGGATRVDFVTGADGRIRTAEQDELVHRYISWIKELKEPKAAQEVAITRNDERKTPTFDESYKDPHSIDLTENAETTDDGKPVEGTVYQTGSTQAEKYNIETGKPVQAPSAAQTGREEERRRSEGEAKEEWSLSEQKAQNGEQFYQNANGDIDLVHIPDEVFESIGYTKAPFRLTPSMINHVRNQHGKEIKASSDEEIIGFIMDVMNNFDHVRLGDNGALIFSVEDGRDRTGKRAITILLGNEGAEYYGIKTSGYENINKLQKRPLLWEGSAKESSTDTATATVTSRDAQQGSEQSGSASVQSNDSDGKVTNNLSSEQENSVKSSANAYATGKNAIETGNFAQVADISDNYELAMRRVVELVRSEIVTDVKNLTQTQRHDEAHALVEASDLPAEQKEALHMYIDADAAADGVNDAEYQMAQQQVQAVEAGIRAKAGKDGNVTIIMLDSGKKAHVVDGNVNDINGTIMIRELDEQENPVGEPRQIAVKQIKKVEPRGKADDLIFNERKRIQQEVDAYYNQQETAAILATGRTIALKDDEGHIIMATVVGENADGTINFQTETGDGMAIPRAEAMRMAEEGREEGFAMKLQAEAQAREEARKQAQAQQQAQAEAEAQRRAEEEAARAEQERLKDPRNRLKRTDGGKIDYTNSNPDDVEEYLAKHGANGRKAAEQELAKVAKAIEQAESEAGKTEEIDGVDALLMADEQAAEQGARLEELNRQKAFWEDQISRIDRREEAARREAERRAAEKRKAEKAEARRQAAYNKPINDARKRMADDPDAMDILSDDNREPRTLEEYVADNIPQKGLVLKNYTDGAGVEHLGLEGELGINHSDMKKLMPFIGKAENGATDITTLAERIWEDMPESIRTQAPDADRDIRDMIINIMSEARQADDIIHFVDNARIREAEAVYRRNEEYERAKAEHEEAMKEEETAPEWGAEHDPFAGAGGEAPFSIANANRHNEQARREGGLILDEKSMPLDKNTRDIMQIVARQLGITIDVKSEEELGEGIEGQTNSAKSISVASWVAQDREAYLRYVIGHELTHAMKKGDKEVRGIWKEFVDLVKTAMGDEKFKEEFDSYRERYDKEYKKRDMQLLSDDDITEEVVCNFVGDEVFQNREFVNELVTRVEKSHKDAASIVKRMRDLISKVLDYLRSITNPTSAEKRQIEALQRARDIWADMYELTAARQREREERANRPDKINVKDREYDVKELEDELLEDLKDKLKDRDDMEIVGVRLVGSYMRGEQRPDSDLDLLMEFKGKAREDDLFNELNDDENRITVNGVTVDVNPITKSKSGTMDEWEKRNEGFSKAEPKFSVRNLSGQIVEVPTIDEIEKYDAEHNTDIKGVYDYLDHIKHGKPGDKARWAVAKIASSKSGVKGDEAAKLGLMPVKGRMDIIWQALDSKKHSGSSDHPTKEEWIQIIDILNNPNLKSVIVSRYSNESDSYRVYLPLLRDDGSMACIALKQVGKKNCEIRTAFFRDLNKLLMSTEEKNSLLYPSVQKIKRMIGADTGGTMQLQGNQKSFLSAKVQQNSETAKINNGNSTQAGAKSGNMPSADSNNETKELSDKNIKFSIRRKPEPEKKGIGYKVFYRGKDGKLYPPMVANPNGADTPIGVWLDADAAPIANQTKTGRNQVKQGGKGTQGGSGFLSYRPGWHLGEIPYALQFNRRDANGEKTLFPKDFVWAEVEYAADKDYQEEATQAGMSENGKYRHAYAGLQHLPEDGFYKYRTNPNPETDPWIITGAMKVNRVLSREEVDDLVRKAGREPQKVEGDDEGMVSDYQSREEAYKIWHGLIKKYGDVYRNPDMTPEDIAMRDQASAVILGKSPEIQKVVEVREPTGYDALSAEGKARDEIYGNPELIDSRKKLQSVARIFNDQINDVSAGAFNYKKEGSDDMIHGVADLDKAGVIGRATGLGLRHYKNALIKVRDEGAQNKTRLRVFNEAIADVDKAIKWYREFAEGKHQRLGDHEDAGIKFSVAIEKHDPFYSNAAKAVTDIKQEKGTGEQWLKMIEKQGGLKKEEDKWMGLSDWLKGKKSVTKAEVQKFIAENSVKVEDVNYTNNELAPKKLQDKFKKYMDRELRTIGSTQIGDAAENAWRRLVDEYGDDFKTAFWLNYDEYSKEYQILIDDALVAESFVDLPNRPINYTRLGYTTEGLENKREIALVVPDIEPYNEHDEIHFGDAGEGRAVAWVRFGDTETHDPEIKKSLDSASEELYDYLDRMSEKYETNPDHPEQIEDKLTAEEKAEHQRIMANIRKYDEANNANTKKVLVIDEIQSKRHQDAREKGYADTEGLTAERQDNGIWHIYKDGEFIAPVASYNADNAEEAIAYYANQNKVPDAPFQKNWHELALKRMLRYAAENGYDKIAWTTGNQQAERYNIGDKIKKIISYDVPATNTKKVELYLSYGETMPFQIDETGKIIAGRNGTTGKQFSDVVGKELSNKILNGEGKDSSIFDFNKNLPSKVIEGDNLRIGAEGMQGFYDQMLPRFMDKYGKKWGVKTQDVELDLPNAEDRIMHSVDVTDAMKESVMQGQPMFSIKRDEEKSLMGVHNISEDKLRKALKLGGLANPSLAVIDTNKGAHTNYGEISLIPKSSLIDAETGRNSGTYLGDAWTPTYPNVIKSVSKKGETKIQSIAREAAGGDETLAERFEKAIHDYVEGNSGNLSFLFLKQKGLNPEIKHPRTTHSHEEFEKIQQIFGEGTSTMPSSGVTDEQEKALTDLMVEKHKERLQNRLNNIKDEAEREKAEKLMLDIYKESITDKEGNLYFAKADEFVHDNWRDERRRNRNEIDWYATDTEANNRIALEGLSEEYNQWKESLLGDEDIDEKLFAGWTRDGYRRYVPNTVENASRLMNRESQTNAYDSNGLGATKSALLKRVETLDEIRKNKGKLQDEKTVGEKMKEASDELFEIIHQLADMQKIDDNPYSNINAAEHRLQEALVKRDPIKYLNEEYGYHLDADGEYAQQIKDFIKSVGKLPAKYFETKFRRPVGLNEFAIAVVPETTSKEVIDGLKAAGLDVRTYDGTDENRKDVTMEAVNKRDDVKFSLNRSDRIYDKRKLDPKKLESAKVLVDEIKDKYMGSIIPENDVRPFVDALKDVAEIAPKKEILNNENYKDVFGEGVESPIGHVKMSDNQMNKMLEKGRQGRLYFAYRTLRCPDLILQKPSKAKEGQETERPYSYLYVKTFANEDGTETTFYYSVTVQKDGLEISMSNYDPKEKQVIREIKENKLAYINEVTLPSEPDNSAQGNQLANPVGDSFESKGSDNFANSKANANISANQEENSQEVQSQDVKFSVKPTKDADGNTEFSYEGDPKFSIRVFHGSGADFEKFDHKFMGTGEGNQSFGWGTYVTEVEDIAKGYAKRIGDIKSSEKRYIESKIEEARKYNIPAQVKYWENELKNKNLEDLQHHLYEVEIPDDNGKNYLYWDKPLTKNTINRIVEALDNRAHNYFTDRTEAFFEYLHNRHAEELSKLKAGSEVREYLKESGLIDQEISDVLYKAGFTGIKVPTNAMRGGNKEGTYNYVIFDENDAQIVNNTKFSIAIPRGKTRAQMQAETDADIARQMNVIREDDTFDDVVRKGKALREASEAEKLEQTIADNQIKPGDSFEDVLRKAQALKAASGEQVKFAISKAERARRAYEREKKRQQKEIDNAQKELRKKVVDEINFLMNDKLLSVFNRSTLSRMLKDVQNANANNLEETLISARTEINRLTDKSQQRQLSELMKLKTQDQNGKGMSIAKNVSDSVRRIMDMIQGRVVDLKATGYEEDMTQLRRQNIFINGENKRLEDQIRVLGWDREKLIKEAETNGTEPDKDALELIDSNIRFKEDKIKDNLSKKEKNLAELAELKTLKQEAEAAKAQNTDYDVQQEIDKLYKKMDDHVEGKATWTTSDSEKLTGLQIIKGKVEIDNIRRDIADLEGKLADLEETLASYKREARRPQRYVPVQRMEQLEQQIQSMKQCIEFAQQDVIRRNGELIDTVKGLIEEGKDSLYNQVEAEKNRKYDLLHNMLGDIVGTNSIPTDKNKEKEQQTENKMKKLFSAQLHSFEYMAKRINENTLGEDGWFYNRFVKGKDGVMEAENNYQRGVRAAVDALDAKAQEIYGYDFATVSEKSSKIDHHPKVFLQHDRAGMVIKEEIPLSKSQAMYLYMVWKMPDGRMKLMNDGFTEKTMSEVREFLDKEDMQFADWIQDEFLSNLRARYNDLYVELYHTSMANIENYVPLKIMETDPQKDSNLADDANRSRTLEERAGALINRKFNLHRVDYTSGAFNIIADHVNKMEEWHAFARVRKDLDYILSNTYVRKQLNANSSGRFNQLYDAAAIAAHAYRADPAKYMDDVVGWLTKGLVGGNIAYRYTTAMKQILSVPAFYGYSMDPRYLAILTKNIGVQYLGNAPAVIANMMSAGFTGKAGFKLADKGKRKSLLTKNVMWCMENMPTFRARVLKGTAGLNYIDEKLGSTVGKWVDKYLDYGMATNQMIDAITCSIGIKSIFDYKYGKLSKAIEADTSLSPEEKAEKLAEAKRMALMDADIYYNATQQSNHAAFLSPMQMSRSMIDRALSVYQNASIGYARGAVTAAQNLWKMSTPAKYRRLQSEYMRRYMNEDPELTLEQARKMANRYLAGQAVLNAVNLAIRGYALNWLWDWGGRGLLGFFQGDDDEKEERLREEAGLGESTLVNVSDIAAMLAEQSSYPLRGLTGVNMGTAIVNGTIKHPLLFWDQVEELVQRCQRYFMEEDYAGLTSEVLYQGLRTAGFDARVWYNIVTGTVFLLKAATDNNQDRDAMIGLMFALNTPNSNRRQVAEELYKDYDRDTYVRNIMNAAKFTDSKYKALMPGVKLLTEKNVMEIYKEFELNHLPDEEFRKLKSVQKELLKHYKSIDELQEAYDKEQDPNLKQAIGKKLIQVMEAEQPEKAPTSEQLIKKARESLMVKDVKNPVYIRMSNYNDAIEDQMLKNLKAEYKPVWEEYDEMYDESPMAAKEFYKQNKAIIDKYEDIKADMKDIASLKKDLETIQDEDSLRTTMEEIRTVRAKALGKQPEGQKK